MAYDELRGKLEAFNDAPDAESGMREILRDAECEASLSTHYFTLADAVSVHNVYSLIQAALFDRPASEIELYPIELDNDDALYRLEKLSETVSSLGRRDDNDARRRYLHDLEDDVERLLIACASIGAHLLTQRLAAEENSAKEAA